MALILNIETATTNCSVALSENGTLLSLRENGEGRVHAESITLFVDEVLKQSGKKISELNAVAVSKGPGSYTGLRIGVSAAKGFCYGLNIPLISLNTLQVMASGFVNMNRARIDQIKNKNPEKSILYCPMLDARRMEVYCALLDERANFVEETSAKIIDENSFSEKLNQHAVIFFGDGAAKCKPLLEGHPNAFFTDGFLSSALMMPELSEEKFRQKQFENAAYFEPYYLKDFLILGAK